MRGKPYVYRDLTAGVRLPYREIPTPAYVNYDESNKRPYARDALNFLPTDSGGVRRRFGSTVWGTPISNLTPSTIYHWQSVGYVVAFTFTNLYTAPITGSSPHTFTSREGAMNVSDAYWSVAEARRSAASLSAVLYASNPATTGTKQIEMTSPTSNATAWTASGGTSPNAVPNGSIILWHGERMFIAGVAANQSRLFWSSLGDPTNWSTAAPDDAGSVDLDTNKGGPITALCPLGNNLLVFKTNQIYLLTDISGDPSTNRRISTDLGSGYVTSVVESPNGVFFVGTRPGLPVAGVFVTDGSQLRSVSEPIDDFLKWHALSTYFGNGYNATFYDNQYIFSLYAPGDDSVVAGTTVPLSTEPDYRQLVYDVPTGSWWPLRIGNELAGTGDIIGVDSWTETPIGLLAAVKNNIYQVLDKSVSADNATAQAYRWSSQFHSFGDSMVDKRVRQIRAEVVGAPTMKALRFYSDSLITPSEVAWETAASQQTERRLYTPGTGRAWSLQLAGSSSSTTDNVELMGYSFMVDPRAD